MTISFAEHLGPNSYSARLRFKNSRYSWVESPAFHEIQNGKGTDDVLWQAIEDCMTYLGRSILDEEDVEIRTQILRQAKTIYEDLESAKEWDLGLRHQDMLRSYVHFLIMLFYQTCPQ